MPSRFRGFRLAAFASLFVLVPFSLPGSPEEEKPVVEDGREFVLETIGGAKGDLPTAIRVTLKNTSKEAISFTEPDPLCPETPDGNRKLPLLGLQLIDEKGRESQFPPVLTETSKAKLSSPKAVMLRPGETWSKEYPLSAFHFWGPCGPAAPVPELFKPGSSEVRFAALLTFADGSKIASGSFTARVKVPKGFFEAPSIARSVEEVDDHFRMMENRPGFPREPPALAEILGWLRQRDFDSHLLAADVLRRRGATVKEAVPALLELLGSTDDRDRILALYAIEGIGLGAKDALPRIQDLWRDPNARVREKAEEAAAAIQGKPAPTSGEPMYAGKPVSHWIAEATRERALKKGGRSDRDNDEEDEERPWKARRILEGMGAKAVPYLIEALRSDDLKARWTVAGVLRDLREAGKVPDDAWEKGLKSESVQIRRGVAEALGSGRFGTGSRARARELSSPVVLALVTALKDSDPEVQANAASALGRPGFQVAVRPLLEALKSPSFEIRRQAAESLGRIESREEIVISALKALVHDEHAYVRSAAAKALRGLGILDSGHVDFAERVKVYAALRATKGPIKETTEEKLDHPSADADGVFFVVDRSGTSMEGFRFAKRYIELVLASLPLAAEFGVVLVDRKALQFPAGPAPAKADEAGKAGAREFLKAAGGGSGSCPLEGFHAALNFAERSSAQKKVVLYIGDGGGTCLLTEEIEYLELAFEAITKRNQQRVEIHALGVGALDRGEGFLLYLAEKNGGTYARLRVKQDDRRGGRR